MYTEKTQVFPKKQAGEFLNSRCIPFFHKTWYPWKIPLKNPLNWCQNEDKLNGG